ncbi:MAG: hypothetical protein GX823_04760 [Clostridiales bacterium]|nr:hypothetical protein [Clostridiales bacterium]
MKQTVNHSLWAKKLSVYILGIVAMAFGVSLAIQAGIGVAPGNVISYAVSKLTVLSVGWCTTLFHVACILAQLAIIKRFTIGLAAQFPQAFILGRLIDFFLWLFSISPPNLVYSIVLICIGILVFSFGIRAMLGANLIFLPSDGLGLAAGEKLGWKYPKVKLAQDIIYTATAAALMLIFSGDVFSVVGIGTVLSAVATGPAVGLFTRLLPFLDIQPKSAAENV